MNTIRMLLMTIAVSVIAASAVSCGGPKKAAAAPDERAIDMKERQFKDEMEAKRKRR